MSPQVDPSHIMQVGMGFWASKTLLSAVELELFTKLGGDGMTAPQIATALELHARAIPDFPDALVALELLDRDGEGSDALYRNTEATALFLDKAARPTSAGSSRCPTRGCIDSGAICRALQTGEPQNEIKHTGKPMFDELYSDPDRLEQFMNAMAGIFGSIQRPGGEVRLLPVQDALRRRRGHRSAVDHRGQPAPPHALHDLRPAGRRADRQANDRRRRAERSGDRGGAVTSSPTPCPSRRHHDGADPSRLEPRAQDALIRAAYDALPEGGAFIVVENLIDDARRSNAFGLLMSLNMLIEFGDAFDYTGADFAGWCTRSVSRTPRSCRSPAQPARASLTSRTNVGGNGQHARAHSGRYCARSPSLKVPASPSARSISSASYLTAPTLEGASKSQ